MCKANVFSTGKGYLTVFIGFITNHVNTVLATSIPNTNLPKKTMRKNGEFS